MASPQAENGHTDIANEIMEALARTRIPGEARQVLDAILRKTYGWHKKEDSISLSQFVELTGLSKVHIIQAVKKLVEMNLIVKKGTSSSLFTKYGNDKAVTYCFQKDYEQWHTLPKKVTLPNSVTYVTEEGNVNVTEKGNETLPNSVPTKETITKEKDPKETITNNNGSKKDAPVVSKARQHLLASIYQDIISDLNQKTGKRFKVTKDVEILLNARIKEGFKYADFVKVHETMCQKWMKDPKMEQYLRPSTLYRPSKFQGYLNAKVTLYDKGIVSAETERGMNAIQEWLEEKEAEDQAKSEQN